VANLIIFISKNGPKKPLDVININKRANDAHCWGPCKNILYIEVYLFTFFSTLPMKLKLGLQIGVHQ
jgi:hypothetical protein